MRQREKAANVPDRRNFPIQPYVLDRTFVSSCRRDRFTTTSRTLEEELSMDGIIYLVGLIVIVMAILSLFGLR